EAEVAFKEASHIIFLVDGRSEITASDRDLAAMLRRLGKPVTLAVNKADTVERRELAHEFHELGIGDVYAVSAEHGMGVDDLLDHVTKSFAAPELQELERGIKVAIIGRPHVAKSTILLAL